MSTPISPLEQLGQSVQQQPDASQPQSQLSPLEQLGQSVQSQPSGEVTNDVGQTVIVPKDGESFVDTIARGVALNKQRQANGTQQSAVDAETKTIPAKAAETLGAAAGIGVAGPAALAAPGEVLPAVYAHTVEGIKAVGAWAAKNPIQAWVLLQTLKETVPGIKKATQLIHGAPGE